MYSGICFDLKSSCFTEDFLRESREWIRNMLIADIWNRSLLIIIFFVCFGREFTCFICVNTPVLWLSLELQWVGRWKATDSNGGCCSWHCDTHLSRKISGNRSCEPWYRVRVRWLVLLLQTSSSTASQDFCFKPSPQLQQFGLMWYNCNASDGLGLLFFFFLIKYV